MSAKSTAHDNLRTLASGADEVLQAAHHACFVGIGWQVEGYFSGALLQVRRHNQSGQQSVYQGYFDFSSGKMASSVWCASAPLTQPCLTEVTLDNGMHLPSTQKSLPFEQAYRQLLQGGARFPMTRLQLKGVKSILSHAFAHDTHSVLYYLKQDGEVGQSIVGLSASEKQRRYPTL